MSGLTSTLWLFRAGVVAALLQLVIVLVATAVLALLSHEGLVGPILVDHAGQVNASTLLSWSCLLIALMSAMTCRRVRTQTAAHIRRMSHATKPNAPGEVTHALIDQAWLGVIVTAMLVLSSPPDIVRAAASLVGFPALAAIGWPALASIGVAWFGALAFAAREAL